MRDFNRIIAAYGPGIARVAASYEADRALREDLTQEISLAIHRALPNLRDEQALAPFVFRIAHNRCVTHVMRQVGERQRAAGLTPPDDVTTPEEQLLAAERSNRVIAAVRRLPLPYRQVMTLLLEELSHAEIALRLGIAKNTVMVHMANALEYLQAHFRRSSPLHARMSEVLGYEAFFMSGSQVAAAGVSSTAM